MHYAQIGIMDDAQRDSLRYAESAGQTNRDLEDKRMTKLRWPFVVGTVVVLVAVLGACSSLGAVPTLASREAAPLAGGGGGAVVMNGQYQEGIVVSGTGTATSDPEVAEVTFGVELQGQNPDELVAEATRKMDAALAAANAFGVMEDKTRTLNYGLWVENVYDPETGRPTGDIVYHHSHQIQVTTDKIDTIGELLAGVVNAGANAISGVNFTVQDSTSLVSSARDAALANAKAKAEQMAGQLQVTLGKPIVVTETSGDYPMTVARGIGGGAMAEQGAPSISAGSFAVSVSVQIVYEIR
jgi:uncharacterized protein YggE